MTRFETTTRPHDLVDVGHSRLGYYRFGQGPDLVFVHGWPLWAATWRHLVDRLADEYTCHLFDLPGCGGSEWGRDSRIGMAPHAESVAAAIDHLGLQRYGLVGHDSGGLVARRVAARHGPRVAGIVLGNTEIPGHHPWQVTMMGLAARLVGGERALRPLLSSRALRRSRLFYGACFEDIAYGDGEFADLFVTPLLEEPRALRGQLRLLQTFDWSSTDTLDEVHARLEAPALLIWGDEDPYFPLGGARRMQGQFGAGADLVVLEGARLFAHEDRADDFVAAMRPFLARHMSTESNFLEKVS